MHREHTAVASEITSMRMSRVWILTPPPVGLRCSRSFLLRHVTVLHKPRHLLHAANRAQPVRTQANHAAHVGARLHQGPAGHGGEEFHPLLILAIGVPAPGGRDDLRDLFFPHLCLPLSGWPFPPASCSLG